MNFKIVLKVLGFLLLVEGISMLFALLVAVIYNEQDITAFIYSSGICMGVGGLLALLTQKVKKDIILEYLQYH